MTLFFYHSSFSLKAALRLWIVVLLLFTASCATYYQRTEGIQTQIAQGQFEQANKQLGNEKKWSENNHRVLYFMNRGMVLFMMGLHEESNKYFDQADYYVEDYRKQFGSEALAIISNPMVKPYKPEDFETILINYYKALNFIALKNYEGALVECRRINIRLQEINDQYKNSKNKYARDAFAHNLMGIIYQAAGDYNNAFIAYRNALDVYENEYTNLFNIGVPNQLKLDLMNSARKIGFMSELQFYEDKFGMVAPDDTSGTGDLVYIWMNGMGPVKSEWSLGFTNMGVTNGVVAFGNDELGTTFPINLSGRSQNEQSAFKDLSVVRVSFPRYLERKPVYQQATLKTPLGDYPLELAQDINAIAFQCLKDRMLREIGNSIIRLAAKQAMENAARNEDKNLGTLVSIVNAFTEKADTRNWQSLPYSISYARVSLPQGEHQVSLQQDGIGGSSTEDFTINIDNGQTTFKAFHQLQSGRPF